MQPEAIVALVYSDVVVLRAGASYPLPLALFFSRPLSLLTLGIAKTKTSRSPEEEKKSMRKHKTKQTQHNSLRAMPNFLHRLCPSSCHWLPSSSSNHHIQTSSKQGSRSIRRERYRQLRHLVTGFAVPARGRSCPQPGRASSRRLQTKVFGFSSLRYCNKL